MTVRLSVLLPVSPAGPQLPEALAHPVHEGVLARLGLGQSFGWEAGQVYAYLAGRGLAVPGGSAVSVLSLRTPFETALQARSVASITGHPFVCGLGIGYPAFAEAVTGHPVRTPSRATVEHVRSVRALLDETTEPPVGSPTLPELSHPPVELAAGVLRPRHARAVAALVDAAITFLAPPAYLSDSLVPALEEGSAAAGRPRPRLVAIVHVALGGDRHPAQTAERVAAGHLQLPHYRDMLEQADVVPAGATMPQAAAALARSGTVIAGPPDRVMEGLDALRRSGVDEIVVNPLDTLMTQGPEMAVEELRELARLAEQVD